MKHSELARRAADAVDSGWGWANIKWSVVPNGRVHTSTQVRLDREALEDFKQALERLAERLEEQEQ